MHRIASTSLPGLVIFAVATCQHAPSSEPSSQPAPAERDHTAPTTGMTVYEDPQSGEFDSPPAGAFAGAHPDRTNSSSAGLAPMSSLVPGGGVIVRLGGRFQNYMQARVDETGELQSACAHARVTPGSTGREED